MAFIIVNIDGSAEQHNEICKNTSNEKKKHKQWNHVLSTAVLLKALKVINGEQTLSAFLIMCSNQQTVFFPKKSNHVFP